MERRNDPGLSTLLGLGAAIAAILMAGLGIGWLVDELVNTRPAFTLGGLALGIVATCCYVYAKLNQYLKE
ncbi:MAG TPA: AtpZ/AtpI family protein [Pseudonocardiaceae bacterium]|nr:AtpZ/AtpI family protein [Pseudonocardiaceae bacterium]